MKKLLFLLLLPHLAEAQIIKLRAYQTKMAEFNGKEFVTTETNKTNILIVFNVPDLKVQTFGETHGDIDLVEIIDQHVDSLGGKWLGYSGIDHDGKKCQLRLLVYSDKQKIGEEDQAYGSLAVQYDKLMLIYYLRKTD